MIVSIETCTKGTSLSLFETITEDEFKQASGVVARPSITPARCDDASLLGRVATPEETHYDCESCGWCTTPNNCAWSRQCPTCKVMPGEHCKASDGRITGLHAERW